MGKNSASKRRNQMKSVNVGSTIDFGFLSEAIATVQSTKSSGRYVTGSTSHGILGKQPSTDCIGAESITTDEIAFNGLTEATNQGEQQDKKQPELQYQQIFMQDQVSEEFLKKMNCQMEKESNDRGMKGTAKENMPENEKAKADGGISMKNEEVVNSANEDCSYRRSEWCSNCEDQIKEEYGEMVGKEQTSGISAGITGPQKPGDIATEDSFKVRKVSESNTLQQGRDKGVAANNNDASTAHLSDINVGVDLVHCKPMEQYLVPNQQIQAHAHGQEASTQSTSNAPHGGLMEQVGAELEAMKKKPAVSTSLEGPALAAVSKGLEFTFQPYRPPPLLRKHIDLENLPVGRTNSITRIDPLPTGLGRTSSIAPAPNSMGRVGLDPSKKTQTSWAHFRQETPSEPINIAHSKPKCESKKISIPFAKDIRQEGEALWRGWIVGYFIEHKLPYMLVKNSAERLWGIYGLVDVLTMDNGFLLFKFNNTKGSEFVLDGGPWHMRGKLIVVRPWEPSLKLEKEQLNNIPIWVKFFNVPLECWTEKGLTLIASAIGRPIKLDEPTAARSRIAYARVCVEVSCEDILPDSFVLDFEEGQKFDIRVEYPWKPLKCDKCKVFGHSCRNENRKKERKQEGNQVDQIREATREKSNEIWREVDNKKDKKSISQMSLLNEMKKEGAMSPKRREEIRGKGKVAFSKGGEMRKRNTMTPPLDSASVKQDGFHPQEKPNLRSNDATTSSGSHYPRARPLKLNKD